MENDDDPDGDACKPEYEIAAYDISPSDKAVHALIAVLRNSPNLAGML